MKKVTMTKELMKQRIEEAIALGGEAAKQRVEVCLWGLNTVKGGAALANELIDELGLERFGAVRRKVEA